MIPIMDNHMHLQLKGQNIIAAERFHKAGGTHLVISHMPYDEFPIVAEGNFKRTFERTLQIAGMVRNATDLKVFVTLGPYPVELIGLAEKYGMERAVDIMKKGMELAADYVKEGEAIAIGEIGRPHFPVSREIWEASNDILLYAMEVARDVPCPVVLHTESATPEVWKDLAAMADRARLPRDKVIKHYSPPAILPEENQGLFPSVLSSRRNIREAISKGTRFFMETDYIDEPSRPNVVLPPDTVPKRTMGLIMNREMTEEQAWTIHKENFEAVYGIELEF